MMVKLASFKDTIPCNKYLMMMSKYYESVGGRGITYLPLSVGSPDGVPYIPGKATYRAFISSQLPFW